MLSSSLFQGTGKGMTALLVTILRTLILTPLFAAVFAFNIGWGLVGIWWGLVAANAIAVTVAFVWARLYIRKLIKKSSGVTQSLT
ncbi:MAG: hypothetical protein DNFNHJIP_00424 [Candidatus Argoarchaeum ethanivorans]|uniref:Uncharacterized protein n=1 Tax=Candidatus Argoarchaeum ethanivorans TaxID=2608793 RepID=A0A812A0F5_9EURY|nr:MAG: hypothetical protein DNFNHJIP_00424 [Candidatus Argoarchaeum ethanivorans]